MKFKYISLGLALSLCVGQSLASSNCFISGLNGLLSNPLSLLNTYPMVINTQSLGNKIPLDFVGLSMEASAMVQPVNLQNNNGLISILSVLGPNGVVRIGGITSDRIEPLLDRVTASGKFVQALGDGWSMIYGVSCALNDPYGVNPPTGVSPGAGASQEVATIVNVLGVDRVIFDIGNEPNVYSTDPTAVSYGALCAGSYNNYITQWEKIYSAIVDGSPSYPNSPVTPNAKFAGTDSASNAFQYSDTYTPQFATMTNSSLYKGHIVELTSHAYGGASTGNPSSDVTGLWIDYGMPFNIYMMAQNANVKYSGLPLRLTESGSLTQDSADNEGNTLGASMYDLWEMITLAQNGWGGVNFHTADAYSVGGYDPIVPTSLNPPTYKAQSTLYAMYMFEQLAGGQILPSTLGLLPLNVPSIAVMGSDGLVRVMIVNMSQNAITVPISTNSAPAYTSLSVLSYTGENYLSTDVNINGATILPNGSWSTGGKAPPATTVDNNGCGASVSIPASSAVLVTINP